MPVNVQFCLSTGARVILSDTCFDLDDVCCGPIRHLETTFRFLNFVVVDGSDQLSLATTLYEERSDIPLRHEVTQRTASTFVTVSAH